MRLHDFINSTAGINLTSQLFITVEDNLYPITHLRVADECLRLEYQQPQAPITLAQFLKETNSLTVNYRITYQNNLTSQSINVWGYRINHEQHQINVH